MDASAPPPAPWRLRGRLLVVPVPIRADAALEHPLPAGLRLLSARGWTVGGLMLAGYDATATLAYRELIVFSALARDGARLGAVVSHIYVDSDASRRGGREIWGLPKELASFGPHAVRQADGDLVRVRGRARRRAVRAPLLAPAFGELGGRPAHAAGRGSVRARPAVAEVEVPAGSPFAGLGLDGRRPALAGEELDLRFPAPA